MQGLIVRTDEYEVVAEGYDDQLRKWADENPLPNNEKYLIGDASFYVRDSRKSIKLASSTRFSGRYRALFVERPAEKNIAINTRRMLSQLNKGQQRQALAWNFVDGIILHKEIRLWDDLNDAAREYVIDELKSSGKFFNSPYRNDRCMEFIESKEN